VQERHEGHSATGPGMQWARNTPITAADRHGTCLMGAGCKVWDRSQQPKAVRDRSRHTSRAMLSINCLGLYAHLCIWLAEAPMGHDRGPLCYRLCLIHLVHNALHQCVGVHSIAVGAHHCSIRARKMPPCKRLLSMRRAALLDVDLVRSITPVFLTQLCSLDWPRT
jgi:hypothetical protein